LLVSQILVCGEENGELGLLHPLQEFAIFGSGPTHFGDGFDIVLGELAFEWTGNTFIEQDSHRSIGIVWLTFPRQFGAPRSLGRAERWGSGREIR
jgi:hypothetical protein